MAGCEKMVQGSAWPIHPGAPHHGNAVRGFRAWKFNAGLDHCSAEFSGADNHVCDLPSQLFFHFPGPPTSSGSRKPLLQAALVAVTSAVVGVILNLAVFFGEKVLLPRPGVFDYFAATLALVSLAVSLRFRSLHYLVPLGALAGMAWHLIR